MDGEQEEEEQSGEGGVFRMCHPPCVQGDHLKANSILCTHLLRPIRYTPIRRAHVVDSGTYDGLRHTGTRRETKVYRQSTEVLEASGFEMGMTGNASASSNVFENVCFAQPKFLS